jgi:hypothetical protein
MSLRTVDEIERAIRELTPGELRELHRWLDENYSQPFDDQIQSDLAAGRLDSAIQGALEDERAGRIRPL